MSINSDMPEAKPNNRADRRRLRTRTAVLTAARQVFASQGVGATTIQDITDLADVAKGSFYNHFDSKEACLEAVVEKTLAELVRRLDVLSEPMRDDPARVIATCLRHSFRVYVEDPTLGRFALRAGELMAVGSMSLGVFGRRDIQRGLDSGRFHFDDLEIVFTMISGGAETLLRRRLEGELPAESEIAFTALALRLLGLPDDEASAIAEEDLVSLDQLERESS
ncbi:MAG: helix-turn-helix transcriptional regulator [bacterium]|nr:helix-turn-helix transcriptional regulator [bacterium]